MARRKRLPAPISRRLSRGAVRMLEQHADGAWIVVTWTGREQQRSYLCPICGSGVAGTGPHLVVWPQAGGSADRRHVHSSCWRRRASQRDPVRW